MSATSAPEASLLFSVADLARVLGISRRTIWRLLEQGKLPQPSRLGTRPRWPTDEIRDWIKAGRAAHDDWLFRAVQTNLSREEQEELASALKLLKRLADS